MYIFLFIFKCLRHIDTSIVKNGNHSVSSLLFSEFKIDKLHMNIVKSAECSLLFELV